MATITMNNGARVIVTGEEEKTDCYTFFARESATDEWKNKRARLVARREELAKKLGV